MHEHERRRRRRRRSLQRRARGADEVAQAAGAAPPEASVAEHGVDGGVDGLQSEVVEERLVARLEVAEGVGGVEARGFGGGLQRGEQCTLVERLRCGAFCGCAREPTPDVGRERGMRVVFDGLPVAAAAVPAGLERFLHAQKLEFEHIARPVADIGGGAVPDIEVDQGDGAGGAAEFDLLFGRLGRIGIRDVVVKLAVAGQAGRAHIGVDVLRIVEGHDPAEAVVADVVVKDEIVLVPGLPLRAGAVEVAVAMGVHRIAGAEQAVQRAVDGGACEDLAYFGDARQDIVAGIALGFECRVELGTDGAVEIGRLVGLDEGVAAGDEFAHGAVVEVGAGHGGLLVAGY